MTDDDELAPGSLVRRWRLGKQLRELRANSGKSMDDAARYLTVKRPTISRIENGRHAILPKNVKFLCQLYEIGAPLVDTLMRQAEETEERGWWAIHSGTMPDWFETYVGFETDAREIWRYESETVPGLLQTPEYARGIREAEPGPLSEADLEKSVKFRLARQQRLVGRPPRLRIVLNEAVVRRPVGNSAQMAAQLRHIADVGRQPWATIQVLPFSIGPHPGTNGPFSLLTLPDEDDPNLVYLEHLQGALYLERQADLTHYTAVFEHLTEVALSPEDSLDFLATLVS